MADQANPCPICYEPIKEDERTRVLPCKHEFCRGCINEWLENSNMKERAPCPYCRGKQKNIAHHFDTKGRFLEFFHKAKIWTVSLDSPANYIKHQGNFYHMSAHVCLNIMQAGGVTTIAWTLKSSLDPYTFDETIEYGDTTTDELAAQNLQALKKILLSNILRYGTGPHRGDLAASEYFTYSPPEVLPRKELKGSNYASFGRLRGCARLEQCEVMEGFMSDEYIIHEANEGQRKGVLHAMAVQSVFETLCTDYSTMSDSEFRLVKEKGDLKVVKMETPSLTAEVRRVLGQNLLCDFDSNISNVVDEGHLYDPKGVHAGLQVMPVVRGRVRNPQKLGGFLFDL